MLLCASERVQLTGSRNDGGKSLRCFIRYDCKWIQQQGGERQTQFLKSCSCVKNRSTIKASNGLKISE